METKIIKANLTINMLTEDGKELKIEGCDIIIIDGKLFLIIPVAADEAQVNKLLELNKLSVNIVFDKALLQTYTEVEGIDFFYLEENGPKIKVVFKDILYIIRAGKFVIFYMIDKSEHVSCKSLDSYETKVLTKDFYRIHHGHIINCNHIDEENFSGRGGYVRMIDKKILLISPGKKSGFKNRKK